MRGKVGITELVLRDGHQSLIATRMKTEDMLPIVEKMDEAGYYSLEMWGGATFDVCMRFLNEDPWERLRKIKAKAKKTRLQMLLRGQNVVGYRHYPDDILIKFVELAAKNGIDVFRIFDALNDLRNMDVAIKAARKTGATVEGAISYTISPVHTIEKFVAFARQLSELGCDTICVKDMAGLLTPVAAKDLTAALVKEVGLPVHVHSHTTGGLAPMSLFAAVEAGATLLDTAISPFSQGSSHTATETVVAGLRGTVYDTGIDLRVLSEIAEYFSKVKDRYRSILDPIAEKIDTNVLVHQIPGGMLSNLVSQLKEQNALDKYNAVLKEVPRVREELGYPPLVTPTSQIVGTQAVFNVILGERYKLVSKEVKDYVRGLYGRSPAAISEIVRRQAIGDEQPSDKRPADSMPPMFDKSKSEISEYYTADEDVLSYAMFPQVAMDFFKKRKSGALKADPQKSLLSLAVPAQQVRKIAIVETVGQQIGLQVGGRRYDLKAERAGSTLTLNFGANVYEIDLSSLPAMASRGAGEAPDKAQSTPAAAPAPAKPAEKPKAEAVKGAIAAPMPGKVVDIRVSAGQEVKKGTVLIVLEAMKMQNEIAAPASGVVKAVKVSKGDSVNGGAALVVLE